ncbi:hypothetical protein Pla175_42970 [Pirellulimonas nuda]|uniref:DUF1444 family protein n=1 Tax=Pirellulimonas nuda TaxID=2528009 RepID=A0A518DHE0_9BACT|nr:DUF1444 family protein [Pirellulimonas nuda]QDU90884.1 hypothetical protein Pla175_42970 [Pirellulimonas nuda]
MGLLDRFRKRLTPDSFAELLTKRLRAAGEQSEIVYDAKTFTLHRGGVEAITYLGNIFSEYERADADHREQVLRTFLATWFTAQLELPAELDDARPDILAAVRTRAYFEVGVPLMALLAGGEAPPSDQMAYADIAGCLAVTPVYDLPTSIRQLDARDLEAWGVTLYEALEIARINLTETTRECAKAGDVYVFAHGDSHDAARILLTDLLGSLDVEGETIAMAPNRELLLVTGSENEEGLKDMAEMARKSLEHERGISGTALRLELGEWAVWLPDASHAAYPALSLLHAQTLVGEYEQQRELLTLQQQQQGADRLFVSSFNATQDQKTGRVNTYCIWPEGMPALLPRTDRVVLSTTGPDGKPSGIVAAAEWGRVEQEVGLRMAPVEAYPERWRVESFPGPEELARIGMADWAAG